MSVAPSLTHAIGSGRTAPGEWGIVRLYPARGMVYRFVSCEHPQEFLDALGMGAVAGNVWIETDDGTRLQLAHVIEAEVVPNPNAE